MELYEAYKQACCIPQDQKERKYRERRGESGAREKQNEKDDETLGMLDPWVDHLPEIKIDHDFCFRMQRECRLCFSGFQGTEYMKRPSQWQEKDTANSIKE